MPEDILKLYNSQGQLQTVQISPGLWQRLEPLLAGLASTPKPQPNSHDWRAFAEFEAAWNFSYPYNPEVKCPCGAHTADWRQGEEFILKNANLGGLLVFHCNQCQGTVRQKFFKDHVACEFSPGAACGRDAAK